MALLIQMNAADKGDRREGKSLQLGAERGDLGKSDKNIIPLQSPGGGGVALFTRLNHFFCSPSSHIAEGYFLPRPHICPLVLWHFLALHPFDLPFFTILPLLLMLCWLADAAWWKRKQSTVLYLGLPPPSPLPPFFFPFLLDSRCQLSHR